MSDDLDDVRRRLRGLVDDADEANLIAIHNELVAYCETWEAAEPRRQLRHATGLDIHPTVTFFRAYLPGEQIE